LEKSEVSSSPYVGKPTSGVLPSSEGRTLLTITTPLYRRGKLKRKRGDASFVIIKLGEYLQKQKKRKW